MGWVWIGKGKRRQKVWEGPGEAFEGPNDHPTNFSPCDNCVHRQGRYYRNDNFKVSCKCDFYPDGSPTKIHYTPLKDIGHKDGMDYMKCVNDLCLKVCEHYKHGMPKFRSQNN